ncbi:hypothetical protein LZ32DRAFT_285709 [Colletotrichum eremochloae]|nr:hypothetical protein LZ32DRAFT_285709 [Colletotrichum eremochloae]
MPTDRLPYPLLTIEGRRFKSWRFGCQPPWITWIPCFHFPPANFALPYRYLYAHSTDFHRQRGHLLALKTRRCFPMTKCFLRSQRSICVPRYLGRYRNGPPNGGGACSRRSSNQSPSCSPRPRSSFLRELSSKTVSGHGRLSLLRDALGKVPR